MLCFASAFVKESERKSFRSEILEKYIEYFQRNRGTLMSIRGIMAGFSKDNTVISKKDFQRRFVEAEASGQKDAVAETIAPIHKETLINANDKKGLFITHRQEVILDFLRNNQKMTIRELFEKLNATHSEVKCSTATIARDLKSLESAGLLKRVGGRSDSGHWEVTEKRVPNLHISV
jgi:DNA-binding MarR family transcriptional regulator